MSQASFIPAGFIRRTMGRCQHCGKFSFPTRKAARAASKVVEKGMRAYRCAADDRMWHFGHLPQRLRAEGPVQFDPAHGLCRYCHQPTDDPEECLSCAVAEDDKHRRREDA